MSALSSIKNNNIAICQCWNEGHFLWKVQSKVTLTHSTFSHQILRFPISSSSGQQWLGPVVARYVGLHDKPRLSSPWSWSWALVTAQSHHLLLRMEPRVGPAPLPLPQPLPQISPRHHNNPDLIQVNKLCYSVFQGDFYQEF